MMTYYMTSYIFWYCPLGYAQGMSDMLAPILYVVDNEVDAFWCFSGLTYGKNGEHKLVFWKLLFIM